MKNHSQALAAPFFAVGLLLAGVGNAPGDTHYVDANSINATPPYTSWTTAATNIQDAVDSAVAGNEILVTNGTYATGGRNLNRVEVDKAVNLHSVNGPQFTTIYGNPVTRCVYLTNGASLFGFTLTHGGVRVYGGGVYCEQAAVVSNCVVSGNQVYVTSAYNYGAGAYGGTLNNCTITGNSTGDNNPNPAYGGGAAFCTLNNCTLADNSVSLFFGGQGSGAYGCILNNCTLTGNYGDAAASHSTLNYCIVYFNSSGSYFASALNYCCTTPQPTSGIGNITNAPLFVDLASGNLRLQSNSPCIDAGDNTLAPVVPDLDGNPRIVGGTVDIGAYEYQSLDLINFGVVSNRFGFNLTGQSNWVIVLDVSSDFTNWTPLTTNTLVGSPFPFSDHTAPSLLRRFYRARLQ